MIAVSNYIFDNETMEHTVHPTIVGKNVTKSENGRATIKTIYN